MASAPRERIKLTYLITDLNVGGVPLHLYRLATSLPTSHFDIRVISLADEGPVGQRLVAAGIPVDACNAKGAWDLRALWRLRRFLKAHPPDVLHALLFHANLSARLMGPTAGVPVSRIVCEIQTVEVERRWHLWLDGLTYRLCRFEVVNSPSVLEHLHREARIPRDRLRCEWGAVDPRMLTQSVPNASDGADVTSDVTRKDSPDEKLIVWTGRLDPIKGFEEMLEAAYRLHQEGVQHQDGIKFKLLLVGEGAYRPTIERLMAEKGMDGYVKLLGQREDVPKLLRSADLFLFCSRTEGLPNSLIEAMAAGLPIVATEVAGNRDLIQHRKTGWLVERENAQAIADGVRHLLSRPDEARMLGDQARYWVMAHLDPRAWVDRWKALYEGLL